MNPSQTGICTSGASWVKRTTQGHFKCRGRSRMERRLRAFVKLHKERLQKSPLFDRETCRRAELPIVMRLYCSLVLYHTNSVLSRGFAKYFGLFFHLMKIDKRGVHPTGGIRDSEIPPVVSKKSMKWCLQIHKSMIYYYNPYLCLDSVTAPCSLRRKDATS